MLVVILLAKSACGWGENSSIKKVLLSSIKIRELGDDMKISIIVRSCLVLLVVIGTIFYSYSMETESAVVPVDAPAVVMGGDDNGTLSAESMSDQGAGDGELEAISAQKKKLPGLKDGEKLDELEEDDALNLDDFGDPDDSSCDFDDTESDTENDDEEERDDLPVL